MKFIRYRLAKLKKIIQQKTENISNGLENFVVEGESAPDLFSSDSESPETDGLIVF